MAEAVEQPAPGVPSGVRLGPLRAGERVTLTDNKNRRHSVLLADGGRFHTTKGAVEHDELIGQPEGTVVSSVGGTAYLALRPLLNEYTVTMPRGAQVIYPKDAAQIAMTADIFPGARVVEAGAGSGALTCTLLRAVGPTGRVRSYERREDFAAQARLNVDNFFSRPHPSWELHVGDLVENLGDEPVDRVVLDMLAPWECVEALSAVLEPGGVFCAYVATTTQLSRLAEDVRDDGRFTEPQAWESLVRGWHLEGLAVRPDHRMVGHTGFLCTARRLADGVEPPVRRRRPSKGAYGEKAEEAEPVSTEPFRPDLP